MSAYSSCFLPAASSAKISTSRRAFFTTKAAGRISSGSENDCKIGAFDGPVIKKAMFSA